MSMNTVNERTNGTKQATEAVRYLLAVGGNGEKIASTFIQYCAFHSVNFGTVKIYIHDADRENGDCNQLRELVQGYKNAHMIMGGLMAATNIILEEENLADCMVHSRLDAMIKPGDPRRNIMNAATTDVDRAMNLLEGQYGRADIGAFANLARQSIYKDSKLIQSILADLEAGRIVTVISVGGVCGGTGASYTVDDVIQITKAAIERNAAANLYTASALLGPCVSNPKPKKNQLDETGAEYDVSSSEAFVRTAATLRYLNGIDNLLPGNPGPDGHSLLDRLYFVGNTALDPGQSEWKRNHQETHKTHFLHMAHAMSVGDFFENYDAPLGDNDQGIRTVRVQNESNNKNQIGWENLPPEYKAEIVSAMRFSYCYRMEIVPLFSLALDDFLNNRVTAAWFTKGHVKRKICMSQSLLDKVIRSIKTMSGMTREFIQCFADIQSVTELGTGTKVVQLFDQMMLESHLKMDLSRYNSFLINRRDYCTPDRLTEGSWDNLLTNLSGVDIMDRLAEDRVLSDALKEACKISDEEEAALKITQLIACALYDIVRVDKINGGEYE